VLSNISRIVSHRRPTFPPDRNRRRARDDARWPLHREALLYFALSGIDDLL
jgi:hypothetical protein